MPVAPANLLSLPLTYLRAQLADCPAFQSWVGAANAAAALASIHYVSTTPATDTPPHAVLGFGRRVAFDRGGVGSFSQFRQDGELALDFYGAVSSLEDADEADEALTFCNAVGEILCELLQRSAGAGFLDFVGLETGPPMRTTEKEERTAGAFQLLECQIRYQGSA